MAAPMVLAVISLALLSSADCAHDRAQMRMQLVEDDWVQYGQNFYRAGSEAATWDAVSALCQQMHHLAEMTCIHSQGEQDFLVSQFGDNQWIGFSDQASEGDFTWVDGDEVDFTYWAEGQPDDNGGDEDCGSISSSYAGMWDDQQCYLELPFVCKVELDEEV